MRAWYFFMAFYILLLHAIGYSCNDVKSTKNNSTKARAYQNTVDEEGEYLNNCSPFCGCTCCATHSLPSPYFTTSLHYNLFFSILKTPRPKFIISKFFCSICSIWRPPRLD